MFGLQESFDREIKEMCAPARLGLKLIENRLEEMGLFLTWRQRRNLRKRLDASNGDELEFNFSDKQVANSKFASEDELQKAFADFVDRLCNDLEEFQKGFGDGLSDSFEAITESAADNINASLKKKARRASRDQSQRQHKFSKATIRTWGDALALMQGLISISDEAAEAYFNRSDDYTEDDDLCDALVRIHAKASTVAKEILLLLLNGFSDGAHARWRTLHELAVTAAFLSQYGNSAARQYIDHHAVEMFKAAREYNRHYSKFGAEEISPEEIAELECRYNELIKEYGSDFRHDYGWASICLNKNKPTFRDIEAAVEMDYSRLEYKEASANVHANPSGVFLRLGLLPEDEIILYGPSILGLAQPAIATINAFTVISTSLLTHGANIDCLVVCKVMLRFASHAKEAFVAVEESLGRQE